MSEISIRPESLADYQPIRDVNRLAFESVIEADLIDALRDGGFVEVSLVAETDATIVGHVLFSRASLVTDTETLPVVSLAPMAVLPSHQRQGIGSRLVETGLQYCQELGHRIVVVLGHPEFYSKFGFSADLANSIASPFGGGDAWMALELVPGALTDVAGRIEYPPPFDAFA